MSQRIDFHPPAEIIEAARKIQEYFLKELNMPYWQFMGIQSREFAAPNAPNEGDLAGYTRADLVAYIRELEAQAERKS